MINEYDTKRIKGDVYIAMDALDSILYDGPTIHEDYLKEKVEVAQRCLNFMKTFYKEEEK